MEAGKQFKSEQSEYCSFGAMQIPKTATSTICQSCVGALDRLFALLVPAKWRLNQTLSLAF